jgi:hypothetical protein
MKESDPSCSEKSTTSASTSKETKVIRHSQAGDDLERDGSREFMKS